MVATHDPTVVDACDRHFVLDEGRLVDHVAPVDPDRLGAVLARPDRSVVEEARPPQLELDPEQQEPEPETPEEPDHEPTEAPLPARSHVNGDGPEPAEQPGYVGKHSVASERVDPDAPFRRPSNT